MLGSSIVMTFDPRPESWFSGRPEARLFSPVQKARAFAELGIDVCIVRKFNKEFSCLEHTQFFDQVVCNDLNAGGLVVGADFRFGHGRKGDCKWLLEQTRKLGMACSVVEPVQVGGDKVSSSRIRRLIIEEGDMATAGGLLGRPWLIEGTITRGRQLGRTIGFPTANLGGLQQLTPRKGVYAAFAVMGRDVGDVMSMPEKVMPAAVSVGSNPTVGADDAVKIEAHIIRQSLGEIYDQPIALWFLDRIREERRFDGLEALKAQIAEDVQQVLAVCGSVGRSGVR
jgi:riboflavin kinase/FMN adenylyltransferase